MRASLYTLLLVALLTGCQHLPESDSSTTNTSITSTTTAENPSASQSATELVELPVNQPTIEQCDISQLSIIDTENIWPRLQQGLQFEETRNADIDRQLQWLQKNGSFIQYSQKNARFYLYFILEELDKQNLPYEFAFLPMIESSFDPFLSHAGTLGLWQFTKETGRNFHLTRDNWFDGRKDPVKSTRAAVKYLKYLGDMFNNDWLLVLAAYNSGEGTVKNAIARNKRSGKPVDFWHLDLPKITRIYIPKIIALSEMHKHPELYQLAFCPIKNQSYFTTVDVPRHISLEKAAELANISREDIRFLNAGITRQPPATQKKYPLNIPVTAVDTFLLAIQNLPPIKSQNTMSSSNSITIAKRKKSSKNTTGDSEKIRYKVKAGDSLWKIAQSYKVKQDLLAQWNNKSPDAGLNIGETIIIWVNQPRSH